MPYAQPNLHLPSCMPQTHLWLSSFPKRAFSCSESLGAQLSSSNTVGIVLFCLRKGLTTPDMQPTLALNSII